MFNLVGNGQGEETQNNSYMPFLEWHIDPKSEALRGY